MAIRSLIRERFFPHLWCPGCGHGHVLNAMLHSVDDLGYDPSSLVMVSGIGCSARIAGYVDFHTMHTLHGRALAFATGIKMSRPDLHVIVPMGDGDAVRMMERYRDHTAPVGSPKLAENPTLVPRGIFTDEDQPEYCARYASIIASQHQE